MATTKTISVAAILLMIAGAAAQAVHEEQDKSVQISGRLIWPDGKPINAYLTISRVGPDGLKDMVSEPSSADGVFKFTVTPGPQYRISLGPTVKTQKTVDTSSGKDVDLGDLVFERCPYVPLRQPTSASPESIGDLKPEQIVIEERRVPFGSLRTSFDIKEPVAELPVCWVGPSPDIQGQWEGGPGLFFERSMSVASFVGAKVKRIQVTRSNEGMSPSQIKDEVRKVWLGFFNYAAFQIGWAEGNNWNIEASIEYDDGKRGYLLTDGWHVKVRDHLGTYWFLRVPYR